MAAFGRPEYDRYVRLAEMMISFLRDHGYNYDANLDQDILDHDGPGVPVENGVDAIIEFNLTPPKDMITLFGQVHDEILGATRNTNNFAITCENAKMSTNRVN